MSLPKMVDLTAVAEQLRVQDPNCKLFAAVKNAGRVQACIADVALARSTLEALAQLRAIQGWAPRIQQTAAEHALLANAIFLYARATDTGGRAGERGSTKIRDRLTSEEQATHDWVVNIRNTALAHVRANEPLADELWHHDLVFAVEIGPGWIPAAMSRRVQVNPTLAGRLRKLLESAEELLKQTYHRRIDFVTEQLQNTPDVHMMFQEHLLDPMEIFGSKEEAAKALSPKPGRRMAGVIDT